MATNEGTYSASDACRATGSGDPKNNDWRRYERVGDGRIRHVGCGLDRAPGYPRWVGTEVLARKRRELRALRDQSLR